MDPSITHQHPQLKKNIPRLRAGDRVRVQQKIKEGNKERTQIFEGLVIKTQHGTGINGTFTVRRIVSKIGVEKCFPLHLPSITKIEKLKSAKLRWAKLYYVRDLIGRKAQKLKREKSDKAVWEDIVAEDDESKKVPTESDGKKETEETEKNVQDKDSEEPKKTADKNSEDKKDGK